MPQNVLLLRQLIPQKGSNTKANTFETQQVNHTLLEPTRRCSWAPSTLSSGVPAGGVSERDASLIDHIYTRGWKPKAASLLHFRPSGSGWSLKTAIKEKDVILRKTQRLRQCNYNHFMEYLSVNELLKVDIWFHSSPLFTVLALGGI